MLEYFAIVFPFHSHVIFRKVTLFFCPRMHLLFAQILTAPFFLHLAGDMNLLLLDIFGTQKENGPHKNEYKYKYTLHICRCSIHIDLCYWMSVYGKCKQLCDYVACLFSSTFVQSKAAIVIPVRNAMDSTFFYIFIRNSRQ